MQITTKSDKHDVIFSDSMSIPDSLQFLNRTRVSDYHVTHNSPAALTAAESYSLPSGSPPFTPLPSASSLSDLLSSSDLLLLSDDFLSTFLSFGSFPTL